MATWHQLKTGLSIPETDNYILVSDGINQMRTSMSFGLNKEAALKSLDNHRKNQPKQSHYVYFGGRPVA